VKFFKVRKCKKLIIKLARKEAELASHVSLQGHYAHGFPSQMHTLAGEIAAIKQEIELVKVHL